MAANKISYDFSNVTQQVIMVWVEHSNPTAELGRRVFNGTPQAPKSGSTLVDGLRPVMHQFKFYRSTNGVTLDSQLGVTLYIDAAVINEVMADNYEYVVGRGTVVNDAQGALLWADPIAGGVTLTDKRLAGAKWAELEVKFRAFGTRGADEIVWDETAGTISLTDGETFSDGDRIFITRFKVVARQVSETASAFMDVSPISSDGAFDNTWVGKNNVAVFAGTIGTTLFPAFNTIPNGTARFSTYSGSQRYWKLSFGPGNSVQYAGEARNTLYLAQNESIELTFKDGACYVTASDTRYDRVGEVIGGGRVLIGTMVADGGGGIELSVSDYPRLIDELTPAQTCSYIDYNVTQVVNGKTYYPNRGKFAISPDGTKFKIPDLRGYTERFLKVVSGSDATRFSDGPMSFQKDGVNMSGVSLELRNGKGGSSTNPLSRGNNGPSGFAGCDYLDDWTPNTVSGDNKYIRFTGGGTDTVSDNVGKLPLIVL